ncbi:DUF3231 family protein [Alkalihalophilus marmarensis]|uniref:DUF3231 family protein n=1 Tax=Alkalihalophilus marmarensis TaxID=521377 RepID=UPI002040D677|nr:DUF3231 family protein [Alkalihalophilus marmarensis]MCM3490566.1 DUF3231 family protein [Alkalihalophilus marmarensis]
MKNIQLTASEIGTLWMTYQQKTMLLRMIEHFLLHTEDKKSKKIMMGLHKDISTFTVKIEKLFIQEGHSIPLGYTEQDVNLEAPKLFDQHFDIMCMKLMKAISMGMHVLHVNMAYREDLLILFSDLTALTQKYYNQCSMYLAEKGLFTRPPYLSNDQGIQFVIDKDYFRGNKLVGDERVLNAIEVAHLYHAIENNTIGLTLMIGFAQSAKEKVIQDYFLKGKKLANQVVDDISQIMKKDDIQFTKPPNGALTSSTISPFSDKLMMYCTSLLCSFSLGSNAFGTAFSLRSDLPLKVASLGKSIFDFASEGAKLMAKYGWMEEPPQMIDRRAIMKSKK